MGTINQAGSVEFELGVRTRVGRAVDSDLMLDSPRVSGVHALVEWRSPGQWEIKDLGSHNGSFVEGQRLVPGRWQRLELGQRVVFGDPASIWTVVDLSRPLIEARCIATGERRTTRDPFLTLSEEPSEWVDVFEERPGAWIVERPGQQFAVRDGDELTIAGRVWRLVLPVASQRTESLPDSLGSVATLVFEFRISPDLEHVELHIEAPSGRWGTDRAHARALLEMAKILIADRGLGSEDERGWIYTDELCSLADYESDARLNVEVHRARKDFARFGLADAATLIQRRRSTRQIRLRPDLRCIIHGA